MSFRPFLRFPLLVPRIFKVREKKSKVNNEHQLRLYKLLDNLRIQELPENDLNELVIVSATMECTSEEDRDTIDTNSMAPVRGSIHIQPYL